VTDPRGGCSQILLVFLVCVAGSLAVARATAAAASDDLMLAIIIDDLGNQRRTGLQAVELPGPVAMAFLPHTPFGHELAQKAYSGGKEVLLHLPMQPAEAGQLPGPGAVRLDHTRSEFARIFARALESVPHVSGVNNHMGSLLTRHPGHMSWLMDELQSRPNVFFVDSYTTHLSVALQVARELELPAMKRDVFLDRVVTVPAMARELQRLKNLARERGFAIGIGHPHPETLAFLARELPLLEQQGFNLVPVKDLLPYRTRQKPQTWHAYSSP